MAEDISSFGNFDNSVLPNFPINFEHSNCPLGGRIQHFYNNWKLITSDKMSLNIVKHGFIPNFESLPPLMIPGKPFNLRLASDQHQALSDGVQELLDLKAISEIDPLQAGEGFLSNIFVRPKTDGGWRVIIDISKLNKFIKETPFKMESVNSIRNAVKANEVAAVIDVRWAYLTVPCHKQFKHYFRFWWQNKLYQFNTLFWLYVSSFYLHKAYS